MTKKNLLASFCTQITVLLCIALTIDYIQGSERINQAYKEHFRGGECVETACEWRSGFDAWVSFRSFLLFSFILGVLMSLQHRSLTRSLSRTYLGILAYVVITSLVIRLLGIPTLHTDFLEGRQWLRIGNSGEMQNIDTLVQVLPYLVVIHLVPGTFGVVAGYPLLLFKKWLVSKL